MQKSLILLILALFLGACEKMDPNPELRDPIFRDLKDQLAMTEKMKQDEEKQLLEHQKNLKAVVPQTGQIKFAQKRIFDSQNKLTRYEQQIKYWKIRIIERKNHTRERYAQAFHKKEEWPVPTEFIQYQSEKRLREAKLSWDVKSRLERAGEGRSPAKTH